MGRHNSDSARKKEREARKIERKLVKQRARSPRPAPAATGSAGQKG